MRTALSLRLFAKHRHASPAIPHLHHSQRRHRSIHRTKPTRGLLYSLLPRDLLDNVQALISKYFLFATAPPLVTETKTKGWKQTNAAIQMQSYIFTYNFTL